MGLDQFLFGIKNCENGNDVSIMKNIRSWRKSYWLHNFIGDIVSYDLQNCVYYELNKYNLEEIINVIDKVLNNNKLADELLYDDFGYDEYYFNDLKSTKIDLLNIIEEDNFDYYLYYAWW